MSAEVMGTSTWCVVGEAGAHVSGFIRRTGGVGSAPYAASWCHVVAPDWGTVSWGASQGSDLTVAHWLDSQASAFCALRLSAGGGLRRV